MGRGGMDGVGRSIYSSGGGSGSGSGITVAAVAVATRLTNAIRSNGSRARLDRMRGRDKKTGPAPIKWHPQSCRGVANPECPPSTDPFLSNREDEARHLLTDTYYREVVVAGRWVKGREEKEIPKERDGKIPRRWVGR